jgi:hypothetical protein
MKDHHTEKTQGYAIVYKKTPWVNVGWFNLYETKAQAQAELERQAKTERHTGRNEQKWRDAVMIVRVTRTVTAHVEEESD